MILKCTRTCPDTRFLYTWIKLVHRGNEAAFLRQAGRYVSGEAVLGKACTRLHDLKPKSGLIAEEDCQSPSSLSRETARGFRPPSSTTEVNLLISFCVSGQDEVGFCSNPCWIFIYITKRIQFNKLGINIDLHVATGKPVRGDPKLAT